MPLNTLANHCPEHRSPPFPCRSACPLWVKTRIRLLRSLVSFHRLRTLIGRSGWVKFASPSGCMSLTLGPLQGIAPTGAQTDNPQPPQYALPWIAFAAVVLVLLAAWHGLC